MRLYIVPLVVLCSFTIAAANAAERSGEIESLKGLTDVHVVVDGITKQAEAAGVKKADVQAQVEKAIKAAGLRVLAANERARGAPTIYLSTIVFLADKSSDDLFVYSIEVSLTQEVRLARSPGVRTQSATWRPAGTIGTLPKSDLPKLKDTVGEYLKKFSTDYHTANK